jgi:hypothetical protein
MITEVGLGRSRGGEPRGSPGPESVAGSLVITGVGVAAGSLVITGVAAGSLVITGVGVGVAAGSLVITAIGVVAGASRLGD